MFISGLILFLIRCIKIRSINLSTTLIRLIVLCSSHSVAPGFFGSAINIDFKRSSGMLPELYISLAISVILSTLNSSVACSNSAYILSGPQALLCFICLIANLTSSFSISGPSMSFLIWGIASRSSSNSSCIYSVHLAIIFPFSINIVPSLLLIQPPEEHVELVA